MAKQQTVVKEKRNVKTYLKNSWQLYAMLIIPVVYMILFKYKPMLGVVVAFKKFNVFQGIWNSPWNRPQMMKVHPAPCHMPVRKNTIRRFR